MTLLTLMKYQTVHVVMQCLYGYIFEVDLKWGNENSGAIKRMEASSRRAVGSVEFQPLTFRVLERIAC